MKFLGGSVLVLTLGLSALAAAPLSFDAVQRADRERVAALLANDASRLTTVLSDDLSYGSAEGAVEGKAAFLTLVATKRLRYSKCEYDEVVLNEPAFGVVTMTGLARITLATTAEAPAEISVRFLAVWREEAGHWRLFAYQSTRMPDPKPAR